MAFTVVPLHNVSLPAGTSIPFGNDLIFQDNPQWVRDDQSFLKHLGFSDERSVLDGRHAFVAEYEAASIGEPDPQDTRKKEEGQRRRTIQQAKTRLAIFANLAIWLRQPTPLCFTVSLHACLWTSEIEGARRPILQQSERSQPLYCHPKDFDNPITIHHIKQAAEFYPAIRSIQQGNALWVALRAIWAGLTSHASDIRYMLFWVALEALFGPDDSTELSHKLAERIAFFIAENADDARNLFKMAKKCYGMRSKIVHGRWQHSPVIHQMMQDTEAIVRTAFRRILENPEALTTFASKKRDEYLSDLLFRQPDDTKS